MNNFQEKWFFCFLFYESLQNTKIDTIISFLKSESNESEL